MFSGQTDKVAPSPNYSWGRQGNSVRYIVLHTTEGNGVGSLAWLTNPASQVSCHYLVMEDGEIVGLVEEQHSSWHAGAISGIPTTQHWTGINPNLESIGIEVAGTWSVPFAPQQLESVVSLIKDIYNRYGYMPIVAHSELSPGNRRDPGSYNMEWTVRTVEGDMAYDEEAVKATIRTMLTSPEGANLIEFAISGPSGFGEKLAQAMGRRVAEAVRDAMAEALRT